MSKVEIYHNLGRSAEMSVVLRDGLKSAKKLIEEGKLEDYSSSWMLENHINFIYFQWFPPHLREYNIKNGTWVSIEVNPRKTFVFNREFRAKGDLSRYNASRMTLTNYIGQHEKTVVLKRQLKQGQTIIWDPITAEPLIVNSDDRRVSDYIWQYLNEVLIEKDIILPTEIKNYNPK